MLVEKDRGVTGEGGCHLHRRYGLFRPFHDAVADLSVTGSLGIANVYVPLFLGSFLLTVPSRFRAVEFPQGFTGYLLSHETYLYIYSTSHSRFRL